MFVFVAVSWKFVPAVYMRPCANDVVKKRERGERGERGEAIQSDL